MEERTRAFTRSKSAPPSLESCGLSPPTYFESESMFSTGTYSVSPSLYSSATYSFVPSVVSIFLVPITRPTPCVSCTAKSPTSGAVKRSPRRRFTRFCSTGFVYKSPVPIATNFASCKIKPLSSVSLVSPTACSASKSATDPVGTYASESVSLIFARRFSLPQKSTARYPPFSQFLRSVTSCGAAFK